MTDDPAQFPDGKLNPSDQGAIHMAVGIEDGRIIIGFPVPVKWVGMNPAQAVELAQMLVRNAMKAGYKEPVTLTLTEH